MIILRLLSVLLGASGSYRSFGHRVALAARSKRNSGVFLIALHPASRRFLCHDGWYLAGPQSIDKATIGPTGSWQTIELLSGWDMTHMRFSVVARMRQISSVKLRRREDGNYLVSTICSVYGSGKAASSLI